MSAFLRWVDKFAGIIALLWIIGGILLVFSGAGNRIRILWLYNYILLGLWFGIALLLVIAGLRRGNQVGRICAAVTILILLEPFLGLGTGVFNLFRKTQYAQIYAGAPECRIEIPLQGKDEIGRFDAVLKEYAVTNGIPKCRNKVYLAYSGPPPCTFKGKHVAIWAKAGEYSTSVRPVPFMEGSLRIAPYDTNYPAKDFRVLADGLVARMRAEFGERVAVTFKELGTQ